MDGAREPDASSVPDDAVISYEIELVDDPTPDFQLGAQVSRNRTSEEKVSPRELVTEREIANGKFYLQVRCQRPTYGLVSVSKPWLALS